MHGESFQEAWCRDGDRIVSYASKSVSALDLSDETRALLRTGLPAEAAPFLSFGPVRTGIFSKRSLPSMAERYGLDKAYEAYRIIGSTGNGDPICLRIERGTVHCLDHERAFEPALMNSSLGQLAEFLL